jgi:hypothetical protein
MLRDNSREYYALRFELAQKLHSNYENKVQTISKDSTPFILRGYLIQQFKKKGFDLRDTYLDLEALSLIDYLGLNNFKRGDLDTSLFNPVRIGVSVKHLVSVGFLKNDSGTYSTTEHYEAFWNGFYDEYRKALKKFSNVKRLGKRRKKLRKEKQMKK